MNRCLENGVQPLREEQRQRLIQMKAFHQAHLIHCFCQTVQLLQGGVTGGGQALEMPPNMGDRAVNTGYAKISARAADGIYLLREFLRGHGQFQPPFFAILVYSI